MQAEKWRVPEELLYSTDNYWVKVDGNEVTIGLTEYGQSTTGDILYLDLIPVGTVIQRGENFGSIEAGKWVGNLVAPVSGVVLESNPLVEANPRRLNTDPYGEGWMLKVKLGNPGEARLLMNADAYRQWMEYQIRREQEDEVAQ